MHTSLTQLYSMSIQPSNNAGNHLIRQLRERERERERERQTDRQTETDRQRQTETD